MKLSLPASLEQAKLLGRATAGNSLSPAQRFSHDYRGYMRDHTRALSDSAIQKREAAAAPDAGRPRTVLEAQLGKPRTGIEIRRMLSRLSSSLCFEDSIAFPERVLIRSWNDKTQGLVTVCAMERGWMPEFSLMHCNPEGEVVKETRGWRTVIAKLIRARMISQHSAWSAFGSPSRDSETWQKAVS